MPAPAFDPANPFADIFADIDTGMPVPEPQQPEEAPQRSAAITDNATRASAIPANDEQAVPIDMSNPFGDISFSREPDEATAVDTVETAKEESSPQVQQEEDPSLWDNAKNSFGNFYDRLQPPAQVKRINDATGGYLERYTGRGVDNMRKQGNLLAALTGVLSPEEFAANIAEINRTMTPRDPSVEAGLKEIGGAEGFWNSLWETITNPKATGAVVLESLPQSVPIIGGGIAGGAAGVATPVPGGAIIGAGAGAGTMSFAVEYLNTVLEEMEAAGVDMNDPQKIVAGFLNEEVMAKAKESGVKRGIPIAAFDAISMGLASRIAAPTRKVVKAAGAGDKVAKVAGATAEIGTQAGLGGGGEAAAQLSDKGEITSMGEVVLEGVAEAVTGVGEIGANKAIDAATPKGAKIGREMQRQVDAMQPVPGAAEERARQALDPENAQLGVVQSSLAQEAENVATPGALTASMNDQAEKPEPEQAPAAQEVKPDFPNTEVTGSATAAETVQQPETAVDLNNENAVATNTVAQPDVASPITGGQTAQEVQPNQEVAQPVDTAIPVQTETAETAERSTLDKIKALYNELPQTAPVSETLAETDPRLRTLVEMEQQAGDRLASFLEGQQPTDPVQLNEWQDFSTQLKQAYLESSKRRIDYQRSQSVKTGNMQSIGQMERSVSAIDQELARLSPTAQPAVADVQASRVLPNETQTNEAQLIDEATRSINQEFLLPEGESVQIRPAAPDQRRTKIAQAVKEAFGTDVVWADFGPSRQLTTNRGRNFGVFNGMRVNNRNAILMDAANENFLNTLGHELTHVLETKHPEIYAQLVQIARDRVSQQVQQNLRAVLNRAMAAESGRTLDEGLLESELVAEMMGEQAQDPTFWTEVFNSAPNRSAAQKLFDAIQDIIVKLLANLQGPKFVQNRNDIIAVRNAATQAFNQWMNQEAAPATGTAVETVQEGATQSAQESAAQQGSATQMDRGTAEAVIEPGQRGIEVLGRMAERIYADAVANESSAMVDAYIEEFGREINPDNARELSPIYLSNPTAFAAFVHEPSSRVAKMAYERVLQDAQPGDIVRFMAGGGGSGKGYALKSLQLGGDNVIIYDAVMGKFPSAAARVYEAIAAGLTAEIYYVNTDSMFAFQNALQRAQRTGRTVPLAILAQAHKGASDTIRQMVGEFAGKAEIRIINNGANTVEYGDVTDVPMYNTKELIGRFTDELNRQVKDGYPADLAAAFRRTSFSRSLKEWSDERVDARILEEGRRSPAGGVQASLQVAQESAGATAQQSPLAETVSPEEAQARVDVAGAERTAETAGELPTRVAFSRENLDAMAANTANSPDGLVLGVTPPVLQALGMQKRPVIITRRKVMKIVNPESVGKATTGYMAGNVDIAGRIPLSTEDLYNLPQMLADPVAVMRSSERSSTGGKGLVILTDKVVDGYPVIVTIADPSKIKVPVRGKAEDFTVEEITTAFPKNTAVNKGGARKPESPLNRDLAQNSVYFNSEKAQQLLPLLKVSIPRLRAGVDNKGVKTPAQIRQKYGDAAFSFEPVNQQPIPRILNERKDVRFSRQAPPTNRSGQPVVTWKMQDRSGVEERWDNITFQLQDKFIDLKDVIIGIEDSVGGPVADPADAYLQEELFHGRAGKRVKDFALRELRPLLESMRADGITIDELDMYLHAKHAKEANAQVRSVNPNIPDGGSGLTDAEADAYLQGLGPAQRAKLDKHHQMVMNITADTRQLMVDYGLETQDTIDTWEQAYQNYVPLFREGAESGSLGIGQGYSVSGKQSKRRKGSTKSVTNILANIALQRERVVSRGEKNRVALSLYQLAVQSPNQNFWLPLNPDTTSTVKAQSAMRQQLLDMGVDPNNADNIAGRPTDQVIDPKSGLVTLRATQNLAGLPNILMVRINGKDRALLFNANDERAMRLIGSLKNLTANQLGAVLSGMAAWTRYFASINTQYNPAFGLYNFVRDLGAGSINLSNTPLAGKQATVISRAFPAVFGIYRDLRIERRGKTPRSGWAKWYEEFESEGGKTGFRDLFARADERRQKLDAELYRHDDMIPKRAFFSIINWLSDFNEAIENGIRLAAYKTAREQGMTKERAASLAKNLTVNFNRKGNVTPQMGAMYAFFNAATQGTARIGQTFRQERGSRTGVAGMSGKGGLILSGLLGLGVAQAIALSLAGFDPDDIDDFIKDRSIIIPTGDGKYKAIPMPLGFNAIPSMARRITEMFMRDENDWTKETLSMLGMMADTFNPLGANTSLLQMVAPTTIDPLVDLATNRDFAGRPIAKPDFDGLDPTPGFTRGRQNSSGFSTWLAEMIDRASGGTGYTPGYFSPTPDQIDYIIGYMTGGIGREVIRTGKTIEAIANNEELATFNVPMVGRFFGDNKQKAVEVGKFYDYVKKLNGHKRNIDGMDRDGKDWESYLAKHPEAEMADYVDKTAREISELKKYREERKAEGASKAELKELNSEIFQIQYEFNLEYRAYSR